MPNKNMMFASLGYWDGLHATRSLFCYKRYMLALKLCSSKVMRHLLLALTLLFISISVFANELEDRSKIEKLTANLFEESKYKQLNELSRKYRDSEERTSSGIWKLTLFYAGLTNFINGNIKDDFYWDDLEKKATIWIEEYPNNPEGYLVLADIVYQRAWMYRGGGWSKDVKEENWKPFREALKKSKKILSDSKPVSEKDPRWYELMIKLARSESLNLNEFKVLVSDAVRKNPHFYQIYFAAIDYLLPKWHGSKLEIEKFAVKAIDATKDAERSGMYARVYWYASQSNYGTKLFTESAVRWKKMSTSIDDVLEVYPDQWNINNFAKFSCLAGDASKTNKLISRIEGDHVRSVWGKGDYYQRCKVWAAKSSIN